MGQQEVYELLKNKRLSGDDRYFNVAQIRRMSIDFPDDNNSTLTIRKSLDRLNYWGIVERKTITGIYHYRFKKSVLDQSSL